MTSATQAACLDALMCAAIVVYARGFLKSFTDGNAAQKADVARLRLSQPQVELHDLLIERRRSAVAHSDWSYHSTQIVEQWERGTLRMSPIVNAWQNLRWTDIQSLAETVGQQARFMVSDLERAAQYPVQPPAQGA